MPRPCQDLPGLPDGLHHEGVHGPFLLVPCLLPVDEGPSKRPAHHQLVVEDDGPDLPDAQRDVSTVAKHDLLDDESVRPIRHNERARGDL
jgi:hypothetical protein